ncbi:MAG: tripartite tricarboxylate transporter substrate binding protein [Lautropia sp.]
MKTKSRLAAFAAAVAALYALAIPSHAQVPTKEAVAALKPKDFPSQPIEMVVVYPAGGGMDLNARLLSKYVEKVTGANTLVNNKTGGAGLVGHTYLATQADKSGHTVGVIANLVFADAWMRAKDRWKETDLEPIAYLNSDGLNLIVNAAGPFKDKGFKDIVDMAKAKPNTVRITNVPGSIYEYMIEQLEAETGAKFLKVPFQGGAPGVAALLGDNVDVAIAFYGEMRGHLDGKRVKPVAFTGAGRSPFVPDAPTLDEALGLKNFVWVATRWVAVPKGVPAPRKAWLAAAFTAAAADPGLQEEFRKLGAIPSTEYDTIAKVDAHIKELARREREFFVKTGRLK